MEQTAMMKQLLLILIITLSLLLRTLIGFHPHSGQGNYHGSKIAYGGDFEAQRHWMEITLHLPLSQWYKYDTQYWGLDYPPLTAYGSYVLGWVSDFVVGSDSVALDSSRGYEDVIHKSFMRGTVVVLDLLLYFPIVYFMMKRLVDVNNDWYEGWLLGVLIQPALLIIDHGHFQYNAVCLALALGSFHYMTDIPTRMTSTSPYYSIDMNCVIGSILFCLALNWKQMALYYAPAVFAYLLGRCFAPACSTSTTKNNNGDIKSYSCSSHGTFHGCKNVLMQILMLGLTVLATFGILWFPFYHYRDNKEETMMDVFSVLFKRIFPFSRGLFEGKVGNLWCAASTKPISIRERIPSSIQPLCALALTLSMMLPFCIILFLIGKMNTCAPNNTSTTMTITNSNNATMNHNVHLKVLLWGSAGSSLSFFLASFQVHEKSILLPLAPLSLLAFEKPTLVFWFSFVALWSMWHLIVVDRLQVPYFASIALFLLYVVTMNKSVNDKGVERIKTNDTHKKMMCSVYLLVKYVVQLSAFAMIALHLLEATVTPPSHLPDLFPVLWVIGSCASFCFMWLMTLLEISNIYFNLSESNDSIISNDKKIS